MYQFYLDGVLLPVTPSALTVKIANQNKTVKLVNEGEVNLLKLPGLSKISFSALLPNQRYPFAQYPGGYQGARYYLSKLESLKTGCAPFAFYVIRTDGSGEMLMAAKPMTVSLESYELHEDAEKYGTDVLAKIELKQCRPYGTKTISFGSAASSTAKTQILSRTATNTVMAMSVGAAAATVAAVIKQKRDASGRPKETTYTVASGDSLWEIARVKLGDGARSSELYALNKEVIEAAARQHGRASSSNGQWLYVGTVLRLPT